MTLQEEKDEYFMGIALERAQKGGKEGEIPVGALLVLKDRIIGAAHNRSCSESDPTAHAEILVLRQGGKRIANYRLLGSTLYCTLEPCTMCIGAIIQARIERLVYGAFDPKSGAVQSCSKILTLPFHNHQLQVKNGLLAEQSSRLLQEFFQARRKKSF